MANPGNLLYAEGEVPRRHVYSTRNSPAVIYAENYRDKENNPANVFVNDRGNS